MGLFFFQDEKNTDCLKQKRLKLYTALWKFTYFSVCIYFGSQIAYHESKWLFNPVEYYPGWPNHPMRYSLLIQRPYKVLLSTRNGRIFVFHTCHAVWTKTNKSWLCCNVDSPRINTLFALHFVLVINKGIFTLSIELELQSRFCTIWLIPLWNWQRYFYTQRTKW